MAQQVAPLTTPPGLSALYNACRNIYRDQPNPLQVTAVVKFWLGGPDPLDYISMYSNPGDSSRNIPPHWHYVSFGLSDLHGDGRVHEISGPDSPSGFGIELTFRLKKGSETTPPTWPAVIMQSLSKYVFQTENTLFPGDHISQHGTLDGREGGKMTHLLLVEDPQLGTVGTCFGEVTFVQLVGITSEELTAAQQWNGPRVANLLRKFPGGGGAWLVTDMDRSVSLTDDPAMSAEIEEGINHEGSNLSAVSAQCTWNETHHPNSLVESMGQLSVGETGASSDGCFGRDISQSEREMIKAALTRGLAQAAEGECRLDPSIRNVFPPSLSTRTLGGVRFNLNLEAAGLLPLALRGRIRHGRHFTFKSVSGETAVTLVAPAVTGAFTSPREPYVAHGPWLHVLVQEELAETMLKDVNDLLLQKHLSLPVDLQWPEYGLTVTIMPDQLS
ncbi:unnamed protein product [Cyprideis torosa]|uniref:Uncharacterized protein n=1 Tax=Cyprideis torosa TaxID=163714 RepID=A0A7R8W3T4_9CRUS|nr:unnamed protein product [Cyprideis torosa]CAG0883225.1 unnamed protein product [Cyprideis torosa]